MVGFFLAKKKMKHGNRGKNIFIAANAFFRSVSLFKKYQKKYFGDRFSPTPVVEKWCPALYGKQEGYHGRRKGQGGHSVR